MISVVIMAGGRGERFWPRSQRNMPKQLLNLTSDKTMIQETVERLKGFVKLEDIYISTGSDYVTIISEQLPMIPKENIIVEPCGRNTAPCIGLAAKHIEQKNPDSTMIVLPSDHLIKNVENFKTTLLWASRVASEGENLVTLGISPTKPETGYGYIHFETGTGLDICGNAYKVKSFVEKPDLRTAQHYLETGEYLWNSGMFIWNVSTILSKIKKHMPSLSHQLDQIMDFDTIDQYNSNLLSIYPSCESVSIDYGIMEKAENIYVLPGIFGWDDVGSWTALDRVFDSDENGNVIKGNVAHHDTKDCIIQSNERLIATVGVEGLVIVETEEVTLICKKTEAQNVKKIIALLKDSNNEQYL